MSSSGLKKIIPARSSKQFVGEGRRLNDSVDDVDDDEVDGNVVDNDVKDGGVADDKVEETGVEDNGLF